MKAALRKNAAAPRIPPCCERSPHALRVQARYLHRIALWVWAICFVALAGCSLSDEPGLDLPAVDFLPPDWFAVGGWRPINVDEDAATEYLLAFVYDGGPVGALIYDSQADLGQGVTFRSYRLLPAYRSGTGQGFIAEPEQQENVVLYQVNRPDTTARAPSGDTDVDIDSGDVEEEPAAAANVPTADELVILGGDTTMTVVWWQNAETGYGVTQVYAPGGLRNFNGAADDLPPTVGTTPILSLSGYFPLHDRSLLCYQKVYTRTLDPDATPADAYQQAVRYQETPVGLRFCRGAPSNPFYPEAVILAFLLNPVADSDLLHPDLPDEQKALLVQFITEMADQSLGMVRVEDIKAYRTIIMADSIAPDTTVCASIWSQTDGLQALLFSLRLGTAGEVDHAVERLLITDVDVIPAPPEGPSVNCANIIQDGVPEGRWSTWY